MKKLLVFLISVGIITLIFGTIYATVQQNYRQSAYDPQIQMAEDSAYLLARGRQFQDISQLYPSQSFNFAQSLSPFIVVYDENGSVVFTTGYFDGGVPTPPIGVLQSAKTKGENRLTWQPRADVRIATVVVPYMYNGKTSFVLAGRNLREVERRIEQTVYIVCIGWLFSMLGLILLYALKK